MFFAQQGRRTEASSRPDLAYRCDSLRTLHIGIATGKDMTTFVVFRWEFVARPL